jgi:hypothetical protein
MLCFLTGMSSCTEDSYTTRSELGGAAAPKVVRIDSTRLRLLTEGPLLTGDRVSVGSESAGGVDVADLSISDTMVVSVDPSGLLYALKPGNAWLHWQGNRELDSMQVVVKDLTDLTSADLPSIAATAPTQSVDTRFPRGRSRGDATGNSLLVSANGDLQAALNAAQPGDEVVLADGATFTGNFVLPAKAGNAWIIVRGESAPAAGQRADAVNQAATVITQNTIAAITAAPGAHHWRLIGFNVRLAPINSHNSNVIRLGHGFEAATRELVSDIILDRMVVSGSTTGGTSRCVALNGIRQAIIDSQLLECHAKGSDAQAIGGWGGPGPYLIENNRLEGSGETIMFGGADPVLQIVPSDITIRRNYFTRPLTWAGVWSIKNILELKNARRVLVEGNVMENNWADGQTGFALLFKAVSQDNRAPWSTMQDVTIRNNVIRNSTSGVNLAYRTSNVPVVGLSRVSITNNLFENVGKDPISGNQIDGRVFQLLDQVTDVTILNNTITLDGETGQAIGFEGSPTVRTTVINNVFPATTYGFKGSGAGSGLITLLRYAPGSVVRGNILPNQDASIFPLENFFPSRAWAQKVRGRLGECVLRNA